MISKDNLIISYLTFYFIFNTQVIDEYLINLL